jgi:hypothetical protein
MSAWVGAGPVAWWSAALECMLPAGVQPWLRHRPPLNGGARLIIIKMSAWVLLRVDIVEFLTAVIRAGFFTDWTGPVFSCT